jgi:hypothetical protein
MPIALKTNLIQPTPRFGESKAASPAPPQGAASAKAGTPTNATSPATPTVKKKPISSFFKGLTSPFIHVAKFIYNEPAKALLYLGGSLATISAFPILGTALSVGLLGYGGYQLITGLSQALGSLKGNNNEKFNQSIEKVGRGTFDIIFTYGAAAKGVRALKSSAELVRNAENLTILQKINVILRQLPKETPAAELQLLPKTLGEVFSDLKSKFLGAFNFETHSIPTNTDFQPLAETVASNQAKVTDLLTKYQDTWGVRHTLEFLKGKNIAPDKIKDLPTLLGALKNDPQLVSTLAKVLEGEASVVKGVELVNDIKGLLIAKEEVKGTPNPPSTP